MDELLKTLSSGADACTIGIFIMFLKHHTRLTIIETKLGAMKK